MATKGFGLGLALARLRGHFRQSSSLGRVIEAGVVAFGVRLLFVLANSWVPQPRDTGTDPGNYVDLAYGISAGQGMWRDGSLTVSWPPVYPYFIAFWIQVDQFVKVGSLRFWVGLGQSALAASVVVAIGLLVRRRMNPRSGVAAAFVLALWPNQVIGAGVIMTEGVATPLYAFGVVVLLWSPRPSLQAAAAGGALFGFAVLTRPSTLAAVFVAAGLTIWLLRPFWKRALLTAGTVVGAFFLVLSPWLMYTQATVGTPVLSSFTGYNLCMGNADDTTAEFNPDRCKSPPNSDTIAEDKRMRDEAIRWIAENPERQPLLILKRAGATMVADIYSVYNMPAPSYESPIPMVPVVLVTQLWWFVALYLAARGLWDNRRSKFVRSAATMWGAALIGPLATIGHIRFHDAVVPFLAICVGARIAARKVEGQQFSRGPSPVEGEVSGI